MSCPRELWGGKTLADIAEAKGVDIADCEGRR